MYPLKTNLDGTIDEENILNAVKPDDYHKPKTKLFAFENTHGGLSGIPIDKKASDKMALTAKKAGLRVHVDGARIFNASVALNTSVKDLAEHVDSLTFCLSKGLSCPVGSVIVGEKDQITEARRIRKLLGSAMRQVGVIAACGIVALDSMVERLNEDHENAKKLAIGLAEISKVEINPDNIHTNLVRFKVPENTGFEVAEKLKDMGILINGSYTDLRMVAHYGIDNKHIDKAIASMSKVMNSI